MVETSVALWSDALGTGFEDEKERGPVVPRISIAQPLSPEMIEGDEKFISGLKNGEFFLSNGEKSRVLGKTLKFVALHSIDRVTKWKYKDATRKKQVFVDQLSIEEFESLGLQKDKAGKYVDETEEGVFIYTRNKNFFILNLDNLQDGILLLSFKGTNFFPALQMIKKFKMKVVNGKRLPMFAFKWQLSTKRYDNDNGFHFGIGKDDEELLLTEIGPVGQDLVKPVTEARKSVDQLLNHVVAETETVEVPIF